jgi:hypothetical protein
MDISKIADSIFKIKDLFSNDWVSLRELSCPSKDIKGYSFLHETRCDGKIISILPYKTVDEDYEFLIRKEVTPCWSLSPEFSSITGGDEGNVVKTTIMELKEEAGYDVDESELIDLGICYGTKSSDTIYSLFSVNLTDKKKGEVAGDGSSLEKIATCVWVKALFLLKVKDPLASTLFLRLMNYLNLSE